MRRYRIRKFYSIAALTVIFALLIAAAAVSADDSSSLLSGLKSVSVVQSDEPDTEGKSAEEENNDGDDVYVSNDGTVFTIPRVAPVSGVYDYAGLFTPDEEERLDELIQKTAARKNIDIVIITTYDVPKDISYSTETSMRYARQFLVDSGFKEDSFVAIIDMNNRVFWSAGYGKYGEVKYTGFGDMVYDKAKSDLSDGDYAEASEIFVKAVNRLDNMAAAAVPTPLSLLISLGLAVVSVVLLIIRHGSTQPSAKNTPAPSVLEYKKTAHDKSFLGTTVHRRHIERSKGGGGFSGGGGGGFSSGSGGSHSGGGGHF